MIKQIAKKFNIEGTPVSCEPYGNGNINRTFLITTDAARRYILQRINDQAFADIDGLMSNISRITDYLTAKSTENGVECHVIPPVRTRVGGTYIRIEDGKDGFYRVSPFAEGTLSLEAPETPEDFRRCAEAFGMFISDLSEFPADTLEETIPNFHNTPDRYRLLRETIERAGSDSAGIGRLEEAKEEIAFAFAREKEAGILQRLRDSGELPARVTHNDTKLNNVLFDRKTGDVRYIIDLDTVMPGLAAYDYGDCIRFGASTAAEDERDLSKVSLDMDMFRAFTEGFVSSCRGLTEQEIETLPLGAKTITLELGVRFLTDYLDGSRYFRTEYPEHNIVRARAQFKLVSDMEAKWDAMNEIV